MRSLFGFLMYAGGAASVVSFLVGRQIIALQLSEDLQRLFTWGGLALVIVGFVGRQMVPPPESNEGTWT